MLHDSKRKETYYYANKDRKVEYNTFRHKTCRNVINNVSELHKEIEQMRVKGCVGSVDK